MSPDRGRGAAAPGAGSQGPAASPPPAREARAADRGRDRLPADDGDRGPAVLPAGERAARAVVDGPDDQQELRGVGIGAGGRRDGHGDAGPFAAPVPCGEHPALQLSHARVPVEIQGSGEAAGR